MKAGETVAVIGPNGAGKTTLLRVISKLIDAAKGELTMEGKSLDKVPSHAVIDYGIAHVPENRRLFPKLSVEDNLKMGAFPPAARAHFARAPRARLRAVSAHEGAPHARSRARSRAASSRCAPSAAR